jgi:hypothetical protein
MSSTIASKRWTVELDLRIRPMGIPHIPISLRQPDYLARLPPIETLGFASLPRNRFAFIVAIVKLKRTGVTSGDY